MNFTPKTEEELKAALLLPKGNYQYQVIKAEDKVSKAGNEYTAATLKVWDREGGEHLIFTNFALIKLIKHFCDVNNMQEQYKLGVIDPHMLVNKCGGMVFLDIEPEKPNDLGGFYPAKNVVKDYVGEPHGSMTMPLKPLPEVNNKFNDDIPF
jgi:hypothetical protein